MKNRIDFNPSKRMTNDELLNLRGGNQIVYKGYCSCRNSAGGINCSGPVTDCSKCMDMCLQQCPGTESSICAGE
jgi:hypothetical protein